MKLPDLDGQAVQISQQMRLSLAPLKASWILKQFRQNGGIASGLFTGTNPDRFISDFQYSS